NPQFQSQKRTPSWMKILEQGHSSDDGDSRDKVKENGLRLPPVLECRRVNNRRSFLLAARMRVSD
ncbi:MAG: hypothetical protein RID59_05435, partial [Hoeflea sp.]